ncbi:ABC transporter substrate-binding protein [Natrialba sp. PRR66]|uniref:ABC transporter substrate-binding protein n=1 Tax=Natrialba sp. PRR66 TaxID=3098146 RepID=UPI002B1DD09F|nr:ABC transporter substrate-binding protein [Natrialba sp. PRR66]
MIGRYSRRQLLGGLAVGTSSLVAGCSEGDNTEHVLRLSKAFSEETLDPISASWLPRWMGLQECLVRIDSDLNLTPSLATDWSTNENGSSWRFELREDVTFHDGEQFDADAAQWSLDRSFSDPSSFISSVPVTSITAEDQYGLRIDLDTPFVPLPAYVAHNTAALVSPQNLGDDERIEPAFTGPFEVESWTPDESIIAVRNEDYYGSHPDIDQIEFEVVLDGKTRELKLLNDELDMVWNQPISSVSTFENDSSTNVHFQQKTQVRCLAFNTDSGPFADKRVRKAANYALNERSNVENILDGVGEVGIGPWPPSIYWANDELTTYAHDPQEAGRLLDSAGWVLEDDVRYRDGEALEITLHTFPTRANFRTLATAMQSQLQNVGFDVDVKLTEWAAMMDAKQQGDFDTTMEARTTFAYPPDPENLASLYHSEDSYMNTGYENEEVDELLDQGRATQDRDQRKQYYDRVQAIVMDDLPISYQSYMTVVHGVRSDIENFTPDHPVGNEYKLAGVSIPSGE